MRHSLAGAVQDEWARAWRRPAQVPMTVLGNALLVSTAWALVPRSWLFEFTGPWGFPVALAGWMYADVSATNVLAQDPAEVLGLLTDTPALEQLLRAKTLVLWALVAPVCAVVLLIVGAREHDLSTAALLLGGVVVLPLGALAMSGWVGIAFPYHQLPIRWRWEHRSRYRPVLVRWAVLVLVPYAVFPAGVLLMLVVPLLTHLLGPTLEFGSVTVANGPVMFVLIGCGVSILLWVLAVHVGARWAARRADPLSSYLRDRDRG